LILMVRLRFIRVMHASSYHQFKDNKIYPSFLLVMTTYIEP
jgi:hypothetical protein